MRFSIVFTRVCPRFWMLHSRFATEAAREKQEWIKERFKEWVWSDDSRRERLCRLYNDTFNHTRVRTFNGDHLTLPGALAVLNRRSRGKCV